MNFTVETCYLAWNHSIQLRDDHKGESTFEAESSAYKDAIAVIRFQKNTRVSCL